MYVTVHAEGRIRARVDCDSCALDIIEALEAAPGTAGDEAIEVATFAEPVNDGTGSNGDQLVVIAREGSIETVMVRRSWNQPFTPRALGVDRVRRGVV